MQNISHDITVAGAGPAGMMMALALSKTPYSVAIVAPSVDPGGQGDARTTTINAAGARMLEALGVWRRLDVPPEPITRIAVIGARPGARARRGAGRAGAGEPASSSNASGTGERDASNTANAVWQGRQGGTAQGGDADISWQSQDTPMAHVVENAALVAALHDALLESGVSVIQGVTVGDFGFEQGIARLGLDAAARKKGAGGAAKTPRHNSALVVACDGAASPLAKLASIPCRHEPQRQSAIAARLSATLHHGGAAWQRFLPGGPIALMPLAGNDLALVWTATNEEAERLVEAPPGAFARACMDAFNGGLGTFELMEERALWPLRPGYRKRVTAPGLILAGDAASPIHPLAGQGYNLALGDGAVLADILCRCHRRGLAPSHPSVRQEFERARLGERTGMSMATSGLNRLFSHTGPVARGMAGAGLLAMDRLPAKNAFLDVARGGRLADASLLRGELPG